MQERGSLNLGAKVVVERLAFVGGRERKIKRTGRNERHAEERGKQILNLSEREFELVMQPDTDSLGNWSDRAVAQFVRRRGMDWPATARTKCHLVMKTCNHRPWLNDNVFLELIGSLSCW